MNELKKFKIFISLFYSLSYAMITILLSLKITDKTVRDLNLSDYLIVIVITITVFVLYFYLTNICKDFKRFLLFLFISLVLGNLFSIFLALNIHRDYFSIPFQIIIIHFIIFVSKTDLFSKEKEFKRIVFYTALLMIIVMSVWEIFMGYSIVTRTEPRWFESIVINLYNNVLIIIIIFYTIRLYHKTGYILTINKNKIFLDDIELSEVLSKEYVMMIVKLINGKNKCSELLDNNQVDCELCLKENRSTYKCKKYKNVYNKIYYIEKIFKVLQIGKITTPENSQKIKYEGWKIELNNYVKVINEDEITP